MLPTSVRSSPLARRGSYGIGSGLVQTFARTFLRLACAASLALVVPPPSRAADAPIRIVALGDSLTAGFGLPGEAAFPTRLEAALRAKGFAVEINNAGVSGDTSSGGLARLDWSVPEGTDGVIVELGANDMLRGVDPAVTRTALQELLRRLKARGIAVLLTGMRAPPNMGQDYARAFDAIFPALAAEYDVVFYPFFLDGVAAERTLNQPDGLHPTAGGVDTIVRRILPKAEELIARIRAKKNL
jgi:acyl-CoA thioesterase-1